MLMYKSACTLKILVFFLMLLTAHHFINKQSWSYKHFLCTLLYDVKIVALHYKN